MASEDNKATVRKFYDAFNRGELGRIDALCAPGVRICHGGPGPQDLETAKRYAALFIAAFPDGENTIEDMIAEGEAVATRGTFRGTHRGEFHGLPPTGRQVAMTWISFDRFADGKFVERRVEHDTLGLLQQLGAIPVPDQVAG